MSDSTQAKHPVRKGASWIAKEETVDFIGRSTAPEQLSKILTKVECWRIYLKDSNTENADEKLRKKNCFEGGVEKLMRNIKTPDDNPSFIVGHHYFGPLDYYIDRVTPNADGAYIFTLSVRLGPLLDDKDKSVKTQLRRESNIAKVHKMVKRNLIEVELLKLLNDGTKPALRKDDVCMEVAVHHPCLLFTTADADYCQWQSEFPELPRRTTFRILPPKGIIPMRTEIFGHSHFSGVLAKEAICTFKNNKGSDKSLTDVSVQCLYWTSDDTKRTSSHFPSLDVEISLLSLTMGAMCILNNDKLEAVIDFSPPPSSRKGPFILVAWNYKQQHNDEKKQTVECTSLICLYDLLTKECLSFARFDPKESLEDSSESDVMKNFKVSQITAIPTRSEDGGTVDISTMTVVVGLETKTKTGKIEGYLGKFKINTDDPVLINGKIQVEKVHNNKLSCVHTIHTIERDIAYTGSYDKTFSICKLDDVLEKASPMEKMVISTHSDIILSVVPLDPKPENVWNRFPMFTASWDTTIRYWERNQLGWASYQFPYEHKKKVSCLAYGAFPLQVPRDSDKTSSCLETSCENNLPCARNVSCVSCYNSCCECSNIDLESDKMCYFLVSGCLDCTLIVWDVSKPKKPVLAKRLVGHEDEVQFVKLLCQGQPTVISASRDRTIRFWDLFTGECFRILKTDFLITGLDISRMYVKHKDKKLESGANQELGDIVVASSDTELLCWNFLSNLRRFMQYTEGLVVSLTTGPQTSAPTNITSINDPCNIYAGTSRASVVVSLNSKQTKVVNVAGQTGEKEIKGRTEAEVTMYTENALAKHKQVRVNALLWVSSSMRGQPFMENVLIAGLADGNICIRVTSVVDPPSFQTTMQNVFCLAWYQPKTNSIVQTPLLFVGGMIDDKDHTMQIFDLDKLLSSSDDNFSVVKHHEAQKTFTGLKFVPVRDVAVHHLADGYAVFITADYKCDTIIWFIHSDNQFEKLQILQGLHCSTFIMNVRIFNPFKEWKKAKGSQKEDAFDKVEWSFIHVDERDKKSCVKYLLKDCEVVVTGGYDGKIGLWPIRTDSLLTGIKKLRSSQNFNRTQTNNAGEQIIGQNEKNNDEKIDFKSMEHEKLQSVTAMTIFFPNGGTNIHPLLLTGSIDALIYVWDIYNQTRLRVLTGHSERINSLVTYFRHGTQPILVSGGDDKCITFWEDGLKHHQYPPSKHTILRAFYHDVLAPHDAWQQIKILQSHYPNVLWEFPHLFYLALIERRESFFVEFIHDLKKVITRIPKYPRLEEGQCSRWMHHKPEGGVDILEYAMHSNTLLALRAILLAWSEVLNKDIEDSINQKALYANRMFNDKLLFELAAIFPVEYTEFISSIRLVRAHSSVGSVNGDLTRTIPFHNRSMVIGSNSFPLDSNFESKRDNDHYKPWCLNMFCYCRPMKSFFSLLRLFKVQVLDGEERHKQSVTPFMLPIKHFSDVKHLYCAVRACNTLHRVDLFESDLLIAAIHHNWNTRGWRIYMTTLVQYGLTVILFVIAIYSYHNVTSTSNEVYGAWRKCRRSMAAFMFFLSLFGLNECFQVFGKYKRLYNFTRQNMKFSRIAHIIVNHFACDWWNIVDCAVVVVGILGMHGRYRRLGNCEEYYNVQHAHEGKYYCLPTESDSFTSCLLAATAVLLWFKVLYFLRPFKAAGQFVVMVMLIVNDIKYFLFVLSCVLVGFAQGFWLLLNNTDSTNAFSSARESYFSTFMFMFGDIDTTDLKNSRTSEFTKMFLVVFMITMMILFFNLLIALMGDTFERTKEKIESHFWKEMASFMVDQAAPVSVLAAFGLFRQDADDEFIHIVKYTSDIKQSGKVFGLRRTDGDSDHDDDDRDLALDMNGNNRRKKKSPLEISLDVVKTNILTNDNSHLLRKDHGRDNHEIIKRLACCQHHPIESSSIGGGWCCKLMSCFECFCCYNATAEDHSDCESSGASRSAVRHQQADEDTPAGPIDDNQSSLDSPVGRPMNSSTTNHSQDIRTSDHLNDISLDLCDSASQSENKLHRHSLNQMGPISSQQTVLKESVLENIDHSSSVVKRDNEFDAKSLLKTEVATYEQLPSTRDTDTKMPRLVNLTTSLESESEIEIEEDDYGLTLVKDRSSSSTYFTHTDGSFRLVTKTYSHNGIDDYHRFMKPEEDSFPRHAQSLSVIPDEQSPLLPSFVSPDSKRPPSSRERSINKIPSGIVELNISLYSKDDKISTDHPAGQVVNNNNNSSSHPKKEGLPPRPPTFGTNVMKCKN